MLEIYVSTDVETDGPVAGKHSILSIGSAAYTAEKEMLSTFSANLETLPNAPSDSKTAAWWLTQPEAVAAAQTSRHAAPLALVRYLGKYLAKGFAESRELNARRFRASLRIQVPTQSLLLPP